VTSLRHVCIVHNRIRILPSALDRMRTLLASKSEVASDLLSWEAPGKQGNVRTSLCTRLRRAHFLTEQSSPIAAHVQLGSLTVVQVSFQNLCKMMVLHISLQTQPCKHSLVCAEKPLCL